MNILSEAGQGERQFICSARPSFRHMWVGNRDLMVDIFNPQMLW